MKPSIQEVIYLKAESNYTIFYLQNGKKHVSGFTLKHHAQKEELTNFVRVNRAYLLNPNYIVNIGKEGKATAVLMADGTKTLVSRRRTPFAS